MISRRGFLGALAAAFAGDPERLLWLPGKKLISVPAPRSRQLLYFATDVPAVCCSQPGFGPFGSREFRELVEETRDRLECEIKAFCEREMVRPHFRELVLIPGTPHVVLRTVLCTDHKTGFKSREQVAYDFGMGKEVLRVDALIEA